jgi:hypothetical protein
MIIRAKGSRARGSCAEEDVSGAMKEIIADPNAPPQWFQQKPQTPKQWQEVISGYDEEETKNSRSIRDALNVHT